MSSSSHPDEWRSHLRTSVTAIERHIAELRSCVPDDDRGRKATVDLAASWALLVEQLALGPEPELRECPVCKRRSMRAAIRCGHCWTKFASPQTTA